VIRMSVCLSVCPLAYLDHRTAEQWLGLRLAALHHHHIAEVFEAVDWLSPTNMATSRPVE